MWCGSDPYRCLFYVVYCLRVDTSGLASHEQMLTYGGKPVMISTHRLSYYAISKDSTLNLQQCGALPGGSPSACASCQVTYDSKATLDGLFQQVLVQTSDQLHGQSGVTDGMLGASLLSALNVLGHMSSGHDGVFGLAEPHNNKTTHIKVRPLALWLQTCCTSCIAHVLKVTGDADCLLIFCACVQRMNHVGQVTWKWHYPSINVV